MERYAPNSDHAANVALVPSSKSMRCNVIPHQSTGLSTLSIMAMPGIITANSSNTKISTPDPRVAEPLRAANTLAFSVKACSKMALPIRVAAMRKTGVVPWLPVAKKMSNRIRPPYHANAGAPRSLPQVMVHGPIADMRCASQVRSRASSTTLAPASCVPHSNTIAANPAAAARDRLSSASRGLAATMSAAISAMTRGAASRRWVDSSSHRLRRNSGFISLPPSMPWRAATCAAPSADRIDAGFRVLR